MGTAQDFSKIFEEKGIKVDLFEKMDQSAQDMSAQLAKIKESDADTLIITAAVDQLTLVFKQAAALGLKKQFITTGGSQNPDELIDQAGAAVNGTIHLSTFAPWVPESTSHPDRTRKFIEEWKKRGFQFAGVTESYRGYDGIRTWLPRSKRPGRRSPKPFGAFWQIQVDGLNGQIEFTRSGPAGMESRQSIPNVYLIRIEAGKVVVPQT
jgi:branched-chain amino acid transport system substrate-binding protein